MNRASSTAIGRLPRGRRARPLAAGAAALALGAALSAPREAVAQTFDTRTDRHRVVGRCAWSYFGDPRSLLIDGRLVTGCVSTRRWILVADRDLASGRQMVARLRRHDELDDHDNPSLAVWRDRLWAFYAPHSGHIWPRNRRFALRYRATRRGLDVRGGFGPERRLSTNTPGGLGYTYPNPIPTRDRLWLFWRGGDWRPAFASTRDGVHWTRARTLVRGPRGHRPYAKYVAGPDGSIHLVVSDAHADEGFNSLYYARIRGGRLLAADGRALGRLRDGPLPLRRLDRLYRFRAATGSAWPHDLTVGPDGRPVVVYTLRRGGADVFAYARWTGTAWRRHEIVAAGARHKTFVSGGITLDHGDPRRVVLSRRVGGWFEVELWRTDDDGWTWRAPVPVTRGSDAHNFRPVIARGRRPGDPLTVQYVHGIPRSFRDFETTVRLAVARP